MIEKTIGILIVVILASSCESSKPLPSFPTAPWTEGLLVEAPPAWSMAMVIIATDECCRDIVVRSNIFGPYTPHTNIFFALDCICTLPVDAPIPSEDVARSRENATMLLSKGYGIECPPMVGGVAR